MESSSHQESYPDRLFVYGIFCGISPNPVKATLHGYTRIVRGHASIVDDSLGVVFGELLDVEDWNYFDQVEGVAQGYYHRFKTRAFNLETGKYEDCWVYQQCTDAK